MGLHCEPLLASILYGYIKQGQSNSMTIPATNDGTSASGISPISGYILNHLWFIILFMFFSEINMNTSTYFVTTGSLSYVMKLLIIFDIKIYRNLPIFVTHETYDFSWTA